MKEELQDVSLFKAVKIGETADAATTPGLYLGETEAESRHLAADFAHFASKDA